MPNQQWFEQIELPDLTRSVDDASAADLADTTVSLTELGPLTPRVTCEFWLVGDKSRGDGPELLVRDIRLAAMPQAIPSGSKL